MTRERVLLSAQDIKARFFPGKSPSAWTLIRKAKAGDIPCVQIGSRCYFDVDVFLDWMDKQLYAPKSPDLKPGVDKLIDVGIHRI